MTSEENKKKVPVLIAPQSILKDLPKDQHPLEYDGDLEDMNAVKKYRIFQFWSMWNDLIVILDKIDDMSKEQLRDLMMLTIDRMGRILEIGDIGLELHS